MTNSTEDKLAFIDAPIAADATAPQAETPAASPPQPEAQPAAPPAEPSPASAATVTPASQQDAPKGDHTVPLPKYLDAYNEARELKRKIAELEAKQQKPEAQAPDPLLDPKGYGEFIRNQTRNEMQGEIIQTRLNISEQMARQVHGDDVVNEAQKAFEAKTQQQPWIAARVMNSQHPWNEMVAWHKQDKLLGEIGDPSKLNDWILARASALAPAAQPQAAPVAAVPPTAQIVAPPPSLSRAPAAAKPTQEPAGPGQAFSNLFG